jgi:E3 ubiquitin-protein ligase HUWE1
MGNCGRKMKRDFNSWVYKRRNGNTRIGSGMNCPKCGIFFHGNTSYNTVNHHLDNCLVSHDFNLINGNLIHTDVNNGAMIISNKNVNMNDNFVWVKKLSEDGDMKWEKEQILKTYADDALKIMNQTKAKTLCFEDKQRWFRLQIEKHRISWTYGADNLVISKTNILQHSMERIKNCNLYKEVKIAFEEEKKVQDAGGLLREWIHLLMKELFSSSLGLFKKADTDEMSYSISPYSDQMIKTLDMYKFCGKIFGKAIFESIPVHAHLDKCLLKHILSKPITLEDVKYFDKPIWKSLCYLRDTPINGNDDFEEYFTVPSGDMVTPSKELAPNGRETRVTDENKIEFIDLKVQWLGHKQIEMKLNAFLQGLYMIIPKEALSVFEVNEIEMVLNGLPFIDIDDWERNTEYKGSYYKSHQVIRWFWETLRSLEQKDLSKFLQYCTGSSRTPVEGFRVLQSNRGDYAKFCIESMKYSKDNCIMKAHTCFNRLDLPQFPAQELVNQNIKMVLESDFSGVFGIE